MPELLHTSKDWASSYKPTITQLPLKDIYTTNASFKQLWVTAYFLWEKLQSTLQQVGTNYIIKTNSPQASSTESYQ